MENAESSLYDLGDGILGLEFRSKMNTFGAGVIEGIEKIVFCWRRKILKV
ncbi:MAG: hypothetical protein U5N85_13960 [Arcicella sp.]|nr:hypothetical protein [Arcicella sp.]